MSGWSDGRPPYEKAKKSRAAKDEAFYKAWGEFHDHCMFCGIGVRQAPWPGLSTHHLIGGQGRSHDACNLVRACDRCHRLAGLERVVENGIVIPTMPLGVCLTVKFCRDGAAWDPERLRLLRGSNLPEMMPIPPTIEAEFRSHRPRDAARFYGG